MSGTVSGVATFNYAGWSTLFPDLATKVNQAQAQLYFDTIAPLYLDNSAASPVQDLTRRSTLLGLLVAHIAQINLPVEQGGTGVVGRVSSASRGSVSVSTDLSGLTGNAAFFAQTQPGLLFWQATAWLRQARYVPGFPQRPVIWP